MKEYQPLDISRHCNVGTTFFPEGTEVKVGRVSYHGLPFQIGSSRKNPRRCWIGFDGKRSRGPVTIPVGKKAQWLIFAHTLVESKLFKGEPIGRVIAHYVFRYANGHKERVAIRERFEMAVIPTAWGGLPFLARPEGKNILLDRDKGAWGSAGFRQCEAFLQPARAYYVWPWKNPKPGATIESITIEPADRKFFLAAITLGHLDEHPFTRTAQREVKIQLPKRANAEKLFDLTVEVDRGTATYPYPLPREGWKKFLKDPQKGWGEARRRESSPAYTEIAGIPSATVTVKQEGKVLGKANWGELQRKGKIKQPRVELELLDRGRNWVHVKVVDDATGKTVPCRVHFRSPEGIPYQPHGFHNHVFSNMNTWHIDIGGDLRMGEISYAYIDGECQGWLPRGNVIVDVARGFEYEPLRAKVRIERGQRELTLRLKRWTNLNAQRWFSGDSHVHFLGTQGAHREAQGEDLNVVNLLASQWGHLFTNSEDFIGRPTATNDGQTIVYCSQENRQHFLGHLTLLGLKKPVYPWCSDGPGEAEMGGTLEETMSHWADACHAQGGTVILPHLPFPNGEPATLIATGRADAVEMLRHYEFCHLEYYRYLNGGYRLPLVGGTDKMSSEVPVGLYRTYAYIPPGEEFTYDNWCKAVREGRTFLSGGAILDFTVNGARVGNTVKIAGNGGTVEVEATAESIFPIHTLQVIERGNVVASTDEKRGARKLRLKAKLKVDRHTWLAARCSGPGYFNSLTHHDVWQRGIFAHTSPVYVAVGGEWWMFDRGTAEYMLTLIDGTLQYIRENATHHEHHDQVTHHHHDHDHLEHLESPFHQARAAIHRRMHQLGIPH